MYSLTIYSTIYLNSRVFYKNWLLNNKRHRVKGPAEEHSNGDRMWFLKGSLHRDNNLPAVELSNGDKKYWLNGDQYLIHEDGTKEFVDWLNRTHRNKDLPAIEYPNGDKEWWVNGKLHREKSPAVKYSNGDEEWWRYGRRHRLDGPAVTIENKQFWFDNGIFIECLH